MASSIFSCTNSYREPVYLVTSRRRRENGVFHCQCRKTSSSAEEMSAKSENAVLRVAWYGSEILGIVSSFFRPARQSTVKEDFPGIDDGILGPVDRSMVVEAIKDDFRRSYFITGNLTPGAYEEDCEFADPAGSFRGLSRFRRNCSNFGSLLERSNMKLMKWEDCKDKGIGHWRFSCVMIFPWKPILSATGYTEYYFDIHSGKVCRHVEHWNVPKMALLKQIFRPSRWAWNKI
ncbi:hypothetical protein HPP92_027547 [Vanilla planifolia]|uniref:Uncharacterized protein n=1 Tax=Vanilla planifolia TaxID=51239 RepID=A0A835UH60_VANPL|nr:hypothetical protein HPP92_027547 [Vanilla planifolia]KAG0460720.1 hypothetical protein HPP92_021017 [Vanilla planifolia]